MEVNQRETADTFAIVIEDVSVVDGLQVFSGLFCLQKSDDFESLGHGCCFDEDVTVGERVHCDAFG